MGQFSHHESCPNCGSRDNVAVWTDGGKMCFSSGCNYSVRSSVKEDVGEKDTNFRIPPLEAVIGYERGISEKTYSLFRVGFSTHALVFPTYENGVCVGAKFRLLEDWAGKHFYWKGGKIGLFGMHTANGKRSVIITEGEFDALAAHEMIGYNYACVSVVHGADGALRDVSHHREWLSTFQTVYVCFDNDGPGENATAKVMALFPPGKAKRVFLPMGYKDANDMLLAGKAKEFKESVESSQGVMPEGLVSTAEAFTNLRNYRKDPESFKGMSTGYDTLDEMTGGLRPGEITLVCGETGSGKTGFVEQVAYNAIERGLKVLWITLEMPDFRVVEHFIEKRLGKPYYGGTSTINVSDAEVDDCEKYYSGKLHFYKQFGKIDVQKITAAIIATYAEFGVSFVVIDHLALLTAGKEVSQIDVMMQELNQVVLEYPVSVWAVGQLSRNGLVRGSEGINQIASSIVRIVRDKRTTVLHLSNYDKTYRYSPTGFGQFYLNYDKETRTYKKISDKDAKHKIQEDLRQAYEDGDEDGDDNYDAQTYLLDKWKKPIREGDTAQQPAHSEPAIRAFEVEVHDSAHVFPRLQLHLAKRKAYICGVEGVLQDRGQEEDSSGDSAESSHHFADVISVFKQENIKATGELNLRTVGR